MGQDQRRRVVRQGALDHLARVDAGAIDAALEQHLERQDPVPRVEEQAGEHLVLLVAQARLEIVAHRLRALQYRIATQALGQVAPAHLQHGLQLRILGHAEPEMAAERGEVRLEQGTQPAELAQQPP